MPSYDDTNRGAIWKNEKKETDRHPDFTGALNVEGVEYWVSAWKRGPDDNPKSPALRFAITAKETKPAPPPKPKPAPAAPDFDDLIPF